LPDCANEITCNNHNSKDTVNHILTAPMIQLAFLRKEPI
jgi:hypothetical protein